MRLPVADPTMLREHTLALLRHHRRALGGVLVLHALAALAGLAGPWLLGRIVDAVAAGPPPPSSTAPPPGSSWRCSPRRC